MTPNRFGAPRPNIARGVVACLVLNGAAAWITTEGAVGYVLPGESGADTEEDAAAFVTHENGHEDALGAFLRLSRRLIDAAGEEGRAIPFRPGGF